MTYLTWLGQRLFELERDAYCEQYDGLIRHIAWRYQTRGHAIIAFEDLVQEGYVQLLKTAAFYQLKPAEERHRLIKVSLFRNLRRFVFKQYAVRDRVVIDAEALLQAVDPHAFEEVYFEELYRSLVLTLNGLERDALDELLWPSPEYMKAMERQRSIAAGLGSVLHISKQKAARLLIDLQHLARYAVTMPEHPDVYTLALLNPKES